MIQYEVPGRAVPAVRMTQKSKWTNPQAQRYLTYKRDAGWYARQATKAMLEGEIEVVIKVYLWRNLRSDADNLAKSLLDSANGICFKDDSQVMKLTVEKIRVKKELEQRAEVTIIEREVKTA
ncbi:RusA family crossover junction endodeoxyribonuclease [Risungbinella massiliensis]|uniref:RusA family crossover junction endodeoxyribonuclease n=1 Tax=Risungbinella massiliensis TaxID=1329796 RepID=UPI0005CBF42B|nr:RusA family crossover junction endodeoxyribonuclease [Risungbinella massiliensis]